jgi:zinc/manganese transport system substrate-binding protein
MGGELLERLSRARTLDGFLAQKGLTARLGGWLGTGASLKAQPVIYYHQNMSYFVDRFGVDDVGYVEDRPGIAPSASHRDALAALLRERGVKIVAVTSYYDDRLATVLAEEGGAKVVRIPGDVGGDAAATDWFAFVDDLVALHRP